MLHCLQRNALSSEEAKLDTILKLLSTDSNHEGGLPRYLLCITTLINQRTRTSLTFRRSQGQSILFFCFFAQKTVNLLSVYTYGSMFTPEALTHFLTHWGRSTQRFVAWLNSDPNFCGFGSTWTVFLRTWVLHQRSMSAAMFTLPFIFLHTTYIPQECIPTISLHSLMEQKQLHLQTFIYQELPTYVYWASTPVDWSIHLCNYYQEHIISRMAELLTSIYATVTKNQDGMFPQPL